MEAQPIPLQAIGIGNGLTDPEVQYAYYPEMAVSTNGHAPAVGPLAALAMRVAAPVCVNAIRACNVANSSFSDVACVAAQTGCNLAMVVPYQASGLNVYERVGALLAHARPCRARPPRAAPHMSPPIPRCVRMAAPRRRAPLSAPRYDMRIPCEVPGLCYDFSRIGKYLSRPEVLCYLGVDKAHGAWEDCNMAVNALFKGDWMKNYQQQLPDLLADGIRVLIYAGDQVRRATPPAPRLGRVPLVARSMGRETAHSRERRLCGRMRWARGAWPRWRVQGTHAGWLASWAHLCRALADRPRPLPDLHSRSCFTVAPRVGLHLQLAGQPGVDAGDGLGGQGRVQQGARPPVVRAHVGERRVWARGRRADGKGSDLHARL
jgi:hypothetical protein